MIKVQHILDNRGTWLRWIPAIFFATMIFIFSSIPGKNVGDSLEKLGATVQTLSPKSLQQASAIHFEIEWLKVGHGIGYFCLGFAVLYALAVYSRRSSLAALIICSFYAIADEFHQAFIPGRSALVQDVLLDSLAALVGILILLGIVKWKSYRKFKGLQ